MKEISGCLDGEIATPNTKHKYPATAGEIKCVKILSLKIGSRITNPKILPMTLTTILEIK